MDIYRFLAENDIAYQRADHPPVVTCEELNGIFAFALWDQRAQRLLLAVDRPGIKPRYFPSDRPPAPPAAS